MLYIWFFHAAGKCSCANLVVAEKNLKVTLTTLSGWGSVGLE